MHPEFAAAIDPIFREALQLFERIEGGEPCDAAVEHGRMLAIFDRAELALGQAPMWRLAKYALAVWIDEMLLTLSWSGGFLVARSYSRWNSSNLEFAMSTSMNSQCSLRTSVTRCTRSLLRLRHLGIPWHVRLGDSTTSTFRFPHLARNGRTLAGSHFANAAETRAATRGTPTATIHPRISARQ